MRKIFLIFIIFLCLDKVISQNLGDADIYAKKYPNSKQVILDKTIKLDFKLDKKGNPVVDIFYSTSILITSDLSYPNIKQSISYTNYKSSIEDFKAWYQEPVNGKYVTKKIQDFTISDELDDNIFHNDIKTMSYTIPVSTKGVIYHESYVKRITDAHFIFPFYIGSFLPIISGELSFNYPEEIALIIEMKEFDELPKPTTSVSGKTKTITYFFKNMDELKDEIETKDYAYLIPKALVRIKSVTDKSGNTNSFLNTPDDLHKYYQNWLDSLNLQNYLGLDSLVQTLIEGKTTDEQKARSIFNWVQGNIKYIAFEEGEQGFVPANACDVFKNKYGDCKGMSSLTKTMLEYAGLEAYYTWIGTRSIPYKYSEFPTPSVDNHMITTLYLNGKPIFLDATDRFIPFGMPSEFIQGKEALVHMSKEKFKIETVPIVEISVNTHRDTLFLSIEDGTIKGKGTTTLTGYFASDFKHRTIFKNTDQVKEYLDAFLEKGSNKFEIKSFTIDKNEFNHEKVVIKYDFEIPDNVKSIGNKKYLNLNLIKIALIPFGTEKDRKYDIDKGYKSDNSFYTEIKIPADYTVEYLPQSSNYSDDFVSYSIKYQQENNLIKYQFSYKEDYITLPAKTVLEYLEKDRVLRNLYNDSVVLTKK